MRANSGCIVLVKSNNENFIPCLFLFVTVNFGRKIGLKYQYKRGIIPSTILGIASGIAFWSGLFLYRGAYLLFFDTGKI
jgi:hypothetical protein